MAESVDDSRPVRAEMPTGPVRCAVRTVVRRMGLERNPMRRASDRVEAGVRVVVVAASLLALPIAVAVGMLLFGHLQALAAQQAATRHPVTAMVVGEPGAMAVPGRSMVVTTARVAWTLPGHDQQTQTTVVPASAERGDATTVWVTRDGDLAAPPMARSDATALSVLAATSLLLSAVGLLALLLAGARRWLDRGRYRAWQADWDEFDAVRRR